MSKPSHLESKKEFQLERLILFSDAVFAIAITLLVIEIKVPTLHGHDVTESALLHALVPLIPKLAGFLISFIIIGMYWSIHHRMFGFVHGYSSKLILLNLFFLFTIVLMPFSTGIFGEYNQPSTMHLITPLAIYVFNLCLTGIANFLLWKYVSNPAHDIAGPFPDPHYVKRARIRSLVVPSVFLLSLPIALWNPYIARYVPMLIPIAIRLTRPRVKKITAPTVSTD